MNNEHLTIISFGQLEPLTSYSLPYFESLISAGFPSAVDNHRENTLDLNDLLIKHPSATFFMRVMGDSMINAGIHSNDILIVDRSLPAAHNKIAVVRINDEFTVKRIRFIDDKILLMPENENYVPIEITQEMDFEVWGVVTFVIHSV